MVDVEALQRENAELRGQVSQLVQQLAKLNERVARMVAEAEAALDAPARPRPRRRRALA